jgi:hypothetical protein
MKVDLDVWGQQCQLVVQFRPCMALRSIIEDLVFTIRRVRRVTHLVLDLQYIPDPDSLLGFVVHNVPQLAAFHVQLNAAQGIPVGMISPLVVGTMHREFTFWDAVVRVVCFCIKKTQTVNIYNPGRDN